MARGLSSLDAGIVWAIVIVAVVFAVIVYGGKRRTQANKPWLSNKRRRRGAAKYNDHGYDPVMIEQVEDSDIEHKFNVINYLEAATVRRIQKLEKVHGKDLAQMAKLERDVKELEIGLQRTRRDLAVGGADHDALRRLIDTRGNELFGADWNTSVNGAPTLSHTLASGEDAEWRIAADHFVTSRRQSGVHPVPRLQLNKVV
ncbi:Hypothetical Protein FCC1311_051072 [Hondaea fermentalgiana]|uniref:Uncharacterized protein n=1 Tax=Hondaea fermentalgiana TaxID=2315210 RepID=A0A2R5GD35_9STRA|nr:Hypothetical Protein FCC1311_051072 [Hondaea fermentalgiana]|eukprot:GBG28886.1 Hypothetical Protein FCC1311_051072 [Hondaea fermentalgiana]